MPKAPTIEYASLDTLFLDPTNPRLGRKVASPKLKQADVLNTMKDWTPEELATSFLESGFWPQEALIVVEEKLYGKDHLVVVEGNRRLAALKLLKEATEGQPASSKWKEIAASAVVPKELFSEIPYIKVKGRDQVSAYLGFRHVTGIKEWKPAEKAEYIAKLIEQEKLSYDEVRRRIGSKAPTVRQHYIAYRLLLQMDEQAGVHIESVENKFSVLYLSLRTTGVRKYLGIDLEAQPTKAKKPVASGRLENLVKYSGWLFGTEKRGPLFTDSRYVDDFGKILENDDAVEYLERSENPRFEVALRKSGAGEAGVLEYVQNASDNVQQALAEAHVYRKSSDIAKAVKRLAVDTLQLVSIFPSVREEALSDWREDAGAP